MSDREYETAVFLRTPRERDGEFITARLLGIVVASLLFSAARFTAFLLHNLIPGNGEIASLLCSRAVNVRGKRQPDLLFLNLDPI
jgi:hypothetical protein